MFHSETRNVQGRDLLIDGMFLHQWNLKHSSDGGLTRPHTTAPRKKSNLPHRVHFSPTESKQSLKLPPHRELKLMQRLVKNAKTSVDNTPPHPGLYVTFQY